MCGSSCDKQRTPERASTAECRPPSAPAAAAPGAGCRLDAPVESVDVSVYVVPTESAESDGTFEWTQTTLIVAEVAGGGRRGLGYTYGDASAAHVISDTLTPVVRGGI